MDDLSEFTQAVLEVMGRIAPEWRARVVGQDAPGSLEFVRTAPTHGVPELVISTEDDELRVDWSLTHAHVTYTGESIAPEEGVRRALKLAEEIQSERLVAIEAREGRWSGEFRGFVPPQEYEDMRRAGRVIKVVSWRGSYAI